MKAYISFLLQTFSKFPDIQFIHVSPEEGSTSAGAMTTNNTLLVRVTSPVEPDVNAKICLGNLKYLSKILSTKQISEHGILQTAIGESLEKEPIVKSIDFTAPRLSIRYHATDPKVGGRVMNIKKQDWNASVKLEPSHAAEFSDAVKLQQVMNPSKNEFKVTQRDGNLVVIFETGEKSSDNDISLVLAKIDGTLPDSYYLNTTNVLSALSLVATADSGTLYFSASVCRVTANVGDHEIEIIIPKNTSGR